MLTLLPLAAPPDAAPSLRSSRSNFARESLLLSRAPRARPASTRLGLSLSLSLSFLSNTSFSPSPLSLLFYTCSSDYCIVSRCFSLSLFRSLPLSAKLESLLLVRRSLLSLPLSSPTRSLQFLSSLSRISHRVTSRSLFFTSRAILVRLAARRLRLRSFPLSLFPRLEAWKPRARTT